MVNTIPNYASIDEMGLHIALESEQSFNAMMQKYGLAELHSVEEGVIMESNGKGIVDTFKGWLDQLWNFIKGLYNKVLDFIKTRIEKVRKFLKDKAAESENKLLERAKKLKNTTKDGKVKNFGKGHYWTGFDKIVAFDRGSDVYDAIMLYDDFVESIPTVLYDNRKTGKIQAERDVEAVRLHATNANNTGFHDDLVEIEKSVKAKLKVSDLDSSSIQKSVKDMIAGGEFEITKSYIVDNWSTIFKYGTDFGKVTSDVKKNLGNVQKKFDSAKRDIEKYKRELDRKSGYGTDTEGLSKVISAMKKSKTTLSAICNATIASVKARCSEATMIVLRVATASKEKDAVGESAVVPASFQTELASLFEF